MLIRRFEYADAERVSALIVLNYQGVLSQHYSPDVIDFFVRKNTPESVIARSKDRDMIIALEEDVVGVAALRQDDVKTMFVHPNYQGRGIAKTLMEKLENIAKQKGIEKIFADSSLAAVRFYEKRGFSRVRKIVSTLDGVEFEEIHMEKYLQ